MPAINFNSTLLRLIKDVNEIRATLRRVTVNLPLFDIANENTPVQITADQNNYVPGNYDILRLSSDQAGRTITGFRGGIKGRFLRLFNVGDYEIILAHQSTSSDAANRMISPTGFDMVLNADGEILLYYDIAIERWIATYNSGADRISVEVQLANPQSIPDITYTRLEWDSVVVDTGNFFNPLVPKVITIPETGWYFVQTMIQWDVNGANLREIRLLDVSDAIGALILAYDSRLAVSNARTRITMGTLLYFPIGKALAIDVWQNSGVPLDVLATTSSTAVTHFRVVKV